MAAEADDLRYWYGEAIGRTTQVTVAVTATALPEPLELGRYIIRCTNFNGATLWLAQGAFGEVTAAAAAPAMVFAPSTLARDLNDPLITFMARPGLTGLSFIRVGGAGDATVQITKVSRGKA
jgi:hypothetical protein